jgi:PAS domain S-box-containing protein
MTFRVINKIGFTNCWLPLLAGILITLAVSWGLNYQNEYEIKVYTNNLVNNTESLIEQRFQVYEYGLRGARGAIIAAGVDDITRKQFENYSNSRNIDQEFPGALGFGFIRRVPASQESSFVKHAREDGVPNFTIRAITPHDNDRFIIEYIYPIEQNKQAMGFDIGSEANRLSAALLAARDDKAYLTAPITLVQDNKKTRRGALILLPIYTNGAQLNTAEDRESAVLGWSYAPLIIDDVLGNINSFSAQAFIGLSNAKESQPFYISHDTKTPYSLEDRVIRDIIVFGQHWEMELIPTNEAVNKLKSWNIGWVIVFGLGLTFCALFIINLLQTDRFTDDQNSETYQVGLQSILTFLKSLRFKRSCPFALLLIFLIFLVSSWFITQNHLQDTSDGLSKVKESALSNINLEATQYRRDLLFLASTPPILALKKLHADGVNSEKMTTASQLLNERLTDIFKAFMLSNKDLYQVRFIEASHDWQERVKVQRVGEELEAFNKTALQSKKNEPYIGQTLNVGVGHVYQSNFNLNREFGEIEHPDRPVWRFSTPLFNADGSPLGIIIINVNADHLLKASVDNIPREMNLYITNKDGEFLLHPESVRAFTFEYGNLHRWQDEFKNIDFLYGLGDFNFSRFQGERGDVLVEQGSFSLDENTGERALEVYSTISQFSVFKKIALEIGSVIVILLLISLIGIAIQYWVWLTERNRQRDGLNVQKENQRIDEITRFKRLLDSAPDATFVMDEKGIIQIVNARAEQVFRYDRLELEGLSIERLVPTYLRLLHDSHVLDQTQQSQAVVIGNHKEIIALGGDGSEFPVEISLSAVNLDDKILISASIRNISKRLAIEEKLRTALHDAKQATAAKSAFLANTSHEIRTPLNAIIGLGYLLSEEQLTEAQHQLVAKIQISGKSLLGIVNDVLDLSKIEANEMKLEAEPVELRELLEEVSSVFVIQAETKNLEFYSELAKNLPSWVVTDSIRIKQILVNLLGNALKFTTIGQIVFTAEVIAESQNLPQNHVVIRLAVTDTGIGISSEAQARLLKPFTQADTSTTRRFGGTGLGLSIVHQLINLMGGKIGMESSENVGSQFWVELPLRVQTLEEIAEQENQNQTLFILIAEDDPADAQQLRKITQSLGWRSEVVSNGVELIDAYISRQENNLRPPDAMIIDCQMPLMDGVEAMNVLADKIGRENIPAVLMVSAHDKGVIINNDPVHYASGFLLKPVDPSSLFNAVNDAVTLNTGNSKRVLQSTRSEAVGAKWLPNIRLLVVDDSPTNLIVVSHVLKHNGALVQTANSGEEALILLEDSSNDYDAVLMDVQMPGIDGLETTERVRKTLGLTSLPIIALTAGALVEEKHRALEAGMNDFLTKPIDPSKLINVLRTLVGAYRGKEIAIESLHSIASETTHEIDIWPVIAGLNLDKAKNLLLGDKALFLNTLDGLLLEYSNLALAPENNIDQPNSVSLRFEMASQVHKLRSVSGMVGAEKIQQLAARAEKMLRSEDNPAEQVLVELSLALQELQQACSATLLIWRKEKPDRTSSKGEAPILQLETVTQILSLLEEQDLSALGEFDENSASFRNALGDVLFVELQEHLEKLNFKEVISMLAPLINTLGTK